MFRFESRRPFGVTYTYKYFKSLYCMIKVITNSSFTVRKPIFCCDILCDSIADIFCECLTYLRRSSTISRSACLRLLYLPLKFIVFWEGIAFVGTTNRNYWQPIKTLVSWRRTWRRPLLQVPIFPATMTTLGTTSLFVKAND